MTDLDDENFLILFAHDIPRSALNTLTRRFVRPMTIGLARQLRQDSEFRDILWVGDIFLSRSILSPATAITSVEHLEVD